MVAVEDALNLGPGEDLSSLDIEEGGKGRIRVNLVLLGTRELVVVDVHLEAGDDLRGGDVGRIRNTEEGVEGITDFTGSREDNWALLNGLSALGSNTITGLRELLLVLTLAGILDLAIMLADERLEARNACTGLVTNLNETRKVCVDVLNY